MEDEKQRKPQSLDWHGWQPTHSPIGIQQKVIATDEVLSEVQANRKGRAISMLKELYVGLSTEAAIKCVNIFSERLRARDIAKPKEE